MSYEENKISALIDGGLSHKQEIYDRLTTLQDKATAASRACIKYMDSQNPQTQKYLESLREHTEVTKEINQLKKTFKREKMKQIAIIVMTVFFIIIASVSWHRGDIVSQVGACIGLLILACTSMILNEIKEQK